ncbi:MAG: ABC transporter substrate-binding protein [Deinococcota bacterium]
MLTVALRTAGGQLDPHLTAVQQDGFINMNIFDRLIYLDSDGELVPWLATSWTPNEDATMWTLTLQDGVSFHDGTPFNAEAVKFNFDRMIAPETASPISGPSLGAYRETVVIDDLTLEVYFDRPAALLPFNLTPPPMGMVSPTAVETHGEQFSNVLIGSGPYKLESTIPRVETVLVRNDDYNWGPASFHEGPAFVPQVRFVFINEQESRMAALLNGEAQIIDEISVADIDALTEDPAYNVFLSPRVGINRGHTINASLSPTDDILVRKALIHAVDKEAINQAVFRGHYPIAYQTLTRGVRFYNDAVEDVYPYDPELAVQLLEEAGWTEINDEGYRVKDGEVLSVNHATWESAVSEPPALIIQSMLRDIGVKMDIEFPGNYTATVNSGDSPYNTALLAVYSPDPGVLLYRSFHSSGMGSTNIAHYSSPEIDALLEAGLETPDAAERTEIYAEIQQLLAEAALNIPIYSNIAVFAVNEEVEGFMLNLHSNPVIFGARFVE